MGKSFLNKAIGLGDRSTLRSAQIQNAASIAVLLAFALALYATSDRSGGFWWFDSASHAFNGVFLHDFFRDREFSHPFEWAVRYFDQYPAITLGFYPPGFAILLVPFFWVFGPNQAAAQALMASASFALGAGTLRLARQCGWDFATALAASVVLVTFPEMLLWERQIQPEVAAYALTIWGCCLLLDWLDCGSSKTLYWAVVLLVGALYVKQTVVFILPVLTLLLIVRSGSRIFWRREVLWAAGIALILLLPLAAITVAFGGMNVEQATAVPRSNGALYYLWALPHQIGWLALLSSLVGAVMLSRRCLGPVGTHLLIFGWIGVGLFFFSLIALKSPRFSTAVLPPIALLATWPFMRIAPQGIRGSFSVGVACALGLVNLYTTPTPVVFGFGEAAATVAHVAPPNSSVLLLVHRSANFIFNLATYQERPDLRVVRAEKLFTHYRGNREFGIRDYGFDWPTILKLLDQNNVGTLVIQRGFWHDLPTIGRLLEEIGKEPFERIVSIPLTVKYRDEQPAVLDIYVRQDYTPRPHSDITIDVPLIGLHVTVPARTSDR
jgi:hypothetical protein